MVPMAHSTPLSRNGDAQEERLAEMMGEVESIAARVAPGSSRPLHLNRDEGGFHH